MRVVSVRPARTEGAERCEGRSDRRMLRSRRGTGRRRRPEPGVPRNRRGAPRRRGSMSPGDRRPRPAGPGMPVDAAVADRDVDYRTPDGPDRSAAWLAMRRGRLRQAGRHPRRRAFPPHALALEPEPCRQMLGRQLAVLRGQAADVVEGGQPKRRVAIGDGGGGGHRGSIPDPDGAGLKISSGSTVSQSSRRIPAR